VGSAVNTGTLVHMSDIEPRRRGGTSRRARADRAYTLVRIASGLLILTIVLFVLAVLGVVSGALAVVAGALTVGAGVALRRTLKA
jgi:small-conductance mechanosensitive channel